MAGRCDDRALRLFGRAAVAERRGIEIDRQPGGADGAEHRSDHPILRGRPRAARPDGRVLARAEAGALRAEHRATWLLCALARITAEIEVEPAADVVAGEVGIERRRRRCA